MQVIALNPTGDWPRAEIESFFERRFEDHIVDGIRPRKAAGVPAAKPVPYLNEVKRIASSLLGRPATPGSDYALTEVVHCKSVSRQGLEPRRGRPGALARCPALYLRRIVEASGARLVVASAQTREGSSDGSSSCPKTSACSCGASGP